MHTQSPTVILASTSPYRSQLLRRLGLSFQAIPPVADEDTEKKKFFDQQLGEAEVKDIIKLAERLAFLKAQSLRKPDAKNLSAIVIGSDQICFFQGKILGKPKTEEKAFETLSRLSGQTHYLVTAVSVQSESRSHTWSEIAKIQFRSLSSEEIWNSISVDHPLDCAGAYKLECSGISLVDRIECEDWTGIQGLPLISLAKELRHHSKFFSLFSDSNSISAVEQKGRKS